MSQEEKFVIVTCDAILQILFEELGITVFRDPDSTCEELTYSFYDATIYQPAVWSFTVDVRSQTLDSIVPCLFNAVRRSLRGKSSENSGLPLMIRGRIDQFELHPLYSTHIGIG